MDLIELLKEVKSIINVVKICEKCENPSNDRKIIGLCGHTFCKKCLDKMDTCFKCNINFVFENLCIDRTSEAIVEDLYKLEELVEKFSRENSNESSIHTSLKTIYSHSEVYDIIESEFPNILTDLGDCKCQSFLQVFNKNQAINDKKEIINKRNAVGETKLFHACKKTNENEVTELLQAGALINIQDYAGWTPLHEAVLSNNLNITEMLLKAGAIVNVPGDVYNTPLHKAVTANNIPMALLLIKYGADIHVRNYEGLNSLDIATPEMKQAIINVKPGTKIFKIPEFKQQYVLYILGDEENDIMKKFFKLANVVISKELNENVTHVIANIRTKIIEPSYKLFLAIAYQIPVITIEWILVCIDRKEIIDYSEYFIIGTEEYACDTVKISQLNKLELNPKLFNGCNFFVAHENPKQYYKINDKIITRKEILKLLTAAGANILKREPLLNAVSICSKSYPWHADPGSIIEECCHYIIYIPSPPNENRQELKYNMRELRHVPYTWIFDCLLQYKLVVPDVNALI